MAKGLGINNRWAYGKYKVEYTVWLIGQDNLLRALPSAKSGKQKYVNDLGVEGIPADIRGTEAPGNQVITNIGLRVISECVQNEANIRSTQLERSVHATEVMGRCRQLHDHPYRIASRCKYGLFIPLSRVPNVVGYRASPLPVGLLLFDIFYKVKGKRTDGAYYCKHVLVKKITSGPDVMTYLHRG